jgi:hypothetical protein
MLGMSQTPTLTFPVLQPDRQDLVNCLKALPNIVLGGADSEAANVNRTAIEIIISEKDLVRADTVHLGTPFRIELLDAIVVIVQSLGYMSARHSNIEVRDVQPDGHPGPH